MKLLGLPQLCDGSGRRRLADSVVQIGGKVPLQIVIFSSMFALVSDDFCASKELRNAPVGLDKPVIISCVF